MKLKSFTALLLACTIACSTIAVSTLSIRLEGSVPPTQNPSLETLPDENEDNDNNDFSENDGGMVENTPVLPDADGGNTDVVPPVAPPVSSQPTTPTLPQKQTQVYIRSVGNNVNLRAGAGTDYAILGVAEKDTTYAVVGKSGKWYQTYYRGKRAYFYSEYAAVLELEKSNDSDVEKVIEEGYKHIGVPYVYGAVRLHDGNGKLLSGFTAQKFDCSSLMQYIFYKGANVLLQVNTRTQVVQGTRVKNGDLRRGDCMYFTNSARKHLKGVERIGHVALYLGDNYILHTASDYARIEKISATRWEYFIEARRFL